MIPVRAFIAVALAVASLAATAAEPAERVSLSALRKLSDTGMKTYKRYQVLTMINGYDTAGGDRLCDSVRYDGYCDPNRDSVFIDADLPAASMRQALHDIRGRRGAQVCAEVEMRPDRKVYLVNYAIGWCP